MSPSRRWVRVPERPIEAGSVITQTWSRARRHGSVYTPWMWIRSEGGGEKAPAAAERTTILRWRSAAPPGRSPTTTWSQGNRSTRDPLVPPADPPSVVGEPRQDERPRPYAVLSTPSSPPSGKRTARAAVPPNGLGPRAAPRAGNRGTVAQLLITAGRRRSGRSASTTRNSAPAPRRSHWRGRCATAPVRTGGRQCGWTLPAAADAEKNTTHGLFSAEKAMTASWVSSPNSARNRAPKMVSAVLHTRIPRGRLAGSLLRSTNRTHVRYDPPMGDRAGGNCKR